MRSHGLLVPVIYSTEFPIRGDKVYIFVCVVRICGIRNNVEHLCNSNLLLYSMYICTSRNLLQCCTSNSNVVQS